MTIKKNCCSEIYPLLVDLLAARVTLEITLLVLLVVVVVVTL